MTLPPDTDSAFAICVLRRRHRGTITDSGFHFKPSPVAIEPFDKARPFQ